MAEAIAAIKELVKTRTSIKGRILKMQTAVNKHNTVPFTLFEVEKHLEKLEKFSSDVEDIQAKIVQLCETDKDIETQVDVSEWFDEKVTEIEQKLVKIRTELSPVVETPNTEPEPNYNPHRARAHDAVRLPKIEIPSFDGKCEDWTAFANLFNATIGNSTVLTGAQKLQYLKGAVKGEPAGLIKSLMVTDDNFTEAWKILEGRYDNEKKIIHALLKKLFSQPKLNTESAKDLQKMLDTTNEVLTGMEALGRKPATFGEDVLIFMVVERMDPESRRHWALTLKGTENPKFEELKDFLKQYVEGLQAGGSEKAYQHARGNGSEVERRQASTHHTVHGSKCLFCKGACQAIGACRSFKALPVEERNSAVQSNGWCFNCLLPGHIVARCPSAKNCRKCKDKSGYKHHYLLHTEPKPKTQQQTSAATFFTEQDSTQVLLSTALVKIKDRSGEEQVCRVLLDNGYQVSLITEACAKVLGLKMTRSNVSISGVSSTSIGAARSQVSMELLSCVHYPVSVKIEALVLPKVTGALPRFPCVRSEWSHLKGLQLADPEFDKPGPIDILLGADVWCDVMREGRRNGPKFTPVAMNSVFGWILSRRVESITGPVIKIHHITCDTDSILKRFWELEELPARKHLKKEEKVCEANFASTFTRDENGRYVVELPFRLPRESLGNSRYQAVSRWKQVEKRLERNPGYKKEYHDFMREYLDLGHMELVPEQDLQPISKSVLIGCKDPISRKLVPNFTEDSTFKKTAVERLEEPILRKRHLFGCKNPISKCGGPNFNEDEIGSEEPSLDEIGSEEPSLGEIGSENPTLGKIGSGTPSLSEIGSGTPSFKSGSGAPSFKSGSGAPTFEENLSSRKEVPTLKQNPISRKGVQKQVASTSAPNLKQIDPVQHFEKSTSKTKSGSVKLGRVKNGYSENGSVKLGRFKIGSSENVFSKNGCVKLGPVKSGSSENAISMDYNATYYLPHHFVLKAESSTTKFRVVFDGSAKSTSGFSLNDCLMVGPTIQDDLFTLLLRFRCHAVALKADIGKMYRQFRVGDRDADFQRIVWRDSPEKPLQDYRLLTLTYGTGSAAYLATRCLQQLGKDELENYPIAAPVIQNDFYVDDFMGGESTPERALLLQKQLCELVKAGGMELRKWSSSDPVLLQSIPAELCEKKENLSFDTDSTIKALGVQWNVFERIYIQRKRPRSRNAACDVCLN